MCFTHLDGTNNVNKTLIKKKIKFSLHIRKFRMEQLQSHIWLTASSFDFATAPLWISLYMREIWFSFLSVNHLLYTSIADSAGILSKRVVVGKTSGLSTVQCPPFVLVVQEMCPTMWTQQERSKKHRDTTRSWFCKKREVCLVLRRPALLRGLQREKFVWPIRSIKDN